MSPRELLNDAMVTDAAFSPEIAAAHRRMDSDQWEDIYVVGDVHGCRRELMRLLEALDVTEDDLVVFVGDLIRKGPESGGVIDLVRERENLVTVRGNNEQKVLDGTASVDLPSGSHQYIESLPLVISWDDVMVVHGGVDPRRHLSDHTPTDLLEMRSIPPENSYDGPFWFETYQGPPCVFFGHTVLKKPVVRGWAIGLDTGCVYGGALTAYDYREETVHEIQAESTYEQRPDSKIVDHDFGTVQ